MRLEVLLGGLKNPQASVRLDVVRVLGMLDEVRALEALRAHYPAETDESVRKAIAWAGKRLYQAQQAGYSTIDEIFRYYGIDREIENTPDAAEEAMLKQMEYDLNRTLQQRQERANLKQAGLAAATGLGLGMVAGSSAMGFSAFSGGLSAGAGAASSNLGSSRPEMNRTRTPAVAPSNADISIWLRRLREGKAPDQREQAAIELAQLNNPAALPHLAVVFITDTAPKVRQVAQKFGKVLYWNAAYWEMEQDGSLAAEIKCRMEAMGKRTDKPVAPPASGAAAAGPSNPLPSSPPSAQEPDVGEILRKAKQNRAARKRKR